MAIRVLLDHGVQENHIIFVTFLAGPCGVSVLNRTFPQVKVIAGEVDSKMREVWLEALGDDSPVEGRKVWCLEPGMGHIGETCFRELGLQSGLNLFKQGDRYYL
jgi:uridine kinase